MLTITLFKYGGWHTNVDFQKCGNVLTFKELLNTINTTGDKTNEHILRK